MPEDKPAAMIPVVKKELPVAPVVSVTKTETVPGKEVVVQQFFPTQVYNIQYPIYNGMKYNGAPNYQVAMENLNPEGEFSEEVKSRPLLKNPLLRGYILGDSPLSGQQQVVEKIAGSELKLTADELRLFSDPSLLKGRRELIFGDQIDSKKGYILQSKEADSMKKIIFFQEHPDLNPELMNTKEEETKTDAENDKKTDTTKPPKKSKKEKSKKIETSDTGNANGGEVNTPEKKDGKKSGVEDRKKKADKPKDGGMKKDPTDPYQH